MLSASNRITSWARPAAGAIEELIRDDQVSGVQVRLEAPYRRWADDPSHPDLVHRPDVGAVVDEGRRDFVVGSMAGQERHAAPADLGQRDRPAGWPIGRRDLDLVAGVEPLVEAGPTEDANLCGDGLHTRT